MEQMQQKFQNAMGAEGMPNMQGTPMGFDQMPNWEEMRAKLQGGGMGQGRHGGGGQGRRTPVGGMGGGQGQGGQRGAGFSTPPQQGQGGQGGFRPEEVPITSAGGLASTQASPAAAQPGTVAPAASSAAAPIQGAPPPGVGGSPGGGQTAAGGPQHAQGLIQALRARQAGA